MTVVHTEQFMRRVKVYSTCGSTEGNNKNFDFLISPDMKKKNIESYMALSRAKEKQIFLMYYQENLENKQYL